MPCLSARILEFFVKLGAIKARDIDLTRLVHYLHIDIIGDKLAGYARNDIIHARGYRLNERYAEREYNEREHRSRHRSRRLSDRRICLGQSVKYTRTDKRRDYRQNAVEQCEQYHNEQYPRSGIPNYAIDIEHA